jgi:hypothetical protein
MHRLVSPYRAGAFSAGEGCATSTVRMLHLPRDPIGRILDMSGARTGDYLTMDHRNGRMNGSEQVSGPGGATGGRLSGSDRKGVDPDAGAHGGGEH